MPLSAERRNRLVSSGPARRRMTQATSLSIVVPVYNEAATIAEIIDKVVHVELQPGIRRQIICVNDGSSDDTRAQLDALPGKFPETDLVIVHKPVNRGKGAALRDGFTHA